MSRFWVEKQPWQKFPRVLTMCKDDGMNRKFVRYVREDDMKGEADALNKAVDKAVSIIVELCGDCPVSLYDMEDDGCAERCRSGAEVECWRQYLLGERWTECDSGSSS